MRRTVLPFTKEIVPEVGPLYFFRCYIGGEAWLYTLVSSEQMKLLTEDPECAGYCSSNSQRLFISADSLNHSVIIHELGHAFFDQTHTSSAGLTVDQVEEVMVEVFALHWAKIVLLSRVVYLNLRLFSALNQETFEGAHDLKWADAPANLINEKFPENLLALISDYDSGDGVNPFFEGISGPAFPPTAKKKKRAVKKKPRKASKR